MAHYTSPKIEEESLACVLCSSTPQSLQFLLCLHSICDQCLKDSRSEVVCPKCSYVTDLVFGPKLQRNFIQDAIVKRNEIIAVQVCLICKQDDKKVIAEFICPECDGGHLCQDCVKKHARLPGMRLHAAPIPLSELFNEEHRDRIEMLLQDSCSCGNSREQVTHYCKTCEKTTCQSCLESEHDSDKHEMLKIADAGAAAVKYRKEITTERENIIGAQSSLSDAIDILKNKVAQKNAEKDDISNSIVNQVEKFKADIDRLGKEFLHDVTQIYQEQKSEDETLIKQMETQSMCMENVLAIIDMMNRLSPRSDVAKHSDYLIHEMTAVQRYHPVTNSSDRSLVLESPTENLDASIFGKIQLTVQGPNVGDIMQKSTITLSRKFALKSTCKSISVSALNHIRGLDITPEGDIVVSGSIAKPLYKSQGEGDNRIMIYSSAGKCKSSINHSIINANQIVFSRGVLYVGDGDKGRLRVMDMSGDILGETGTSERLEGQVGVTVRGNRIFLTSSAANMIYSCTKADREATPFVSLLIPQSGPQYLCVTGRNNIAVSNHEAHSVCVYNQEGALLYTFGGKGHDDDKLKNPQGICSDKAGRIYVADYGNHRVSVISSEGQLVGHIVTKKDHKIEFPVCVQVSGNKLVLSCWPNKLYIFTLVEVQ